MLSWHNKLKDLHPALTDSFGLPPLTMNLLNEKCSERQDLEAICFPKHSLLVTQHQSINIGILFFKWEMYLHVVQAVIPAPPVTSDHWMKLKSGCHGKKAFTALLTNFPFPPSPFPHSSLSLFTCPDLILCHSCELNWLILTLSLEQCQSWQQGKQQRCTVKRSERKNGWRRRISLLPEINLIISQKAGQGTKVLKARVPMKVANRAVPVSAEDAAVWGAPRLLVWFYTASSQHENKELTIIHLHALGSSSTF